MKKTGITTRSSNYYQFQETKHKKINTPFHNAMSI